MRRRALALVAFLAGLFCYWTLKQEPLPVAGVEHADGYTRLSGVVHVHTTLSDGGGSADEVIAAAKDAGLSFVVITDHNNVDAKAFEGYRGEVLVIAGTELSTTAGHIVGVGVSDPAFRFSGEARDGLADIRDLGGMAFAAHPTNTREDFRFTGWDLPGPWGIEILNGDSQWRAAGWARLARTAATYWLNPPHALMGSWTSDPEALAQWDRLLAARDVAAIVGADAHQRMAVGKGYALPFPSYESQFRVALNHVLVKQPSTGDAAVDAPLVLDALRRGRSYIGLDGIALADGISFVAEAGGERVTMGETIAPRPGLRLVLAGRMPRGARVAILKDGRAVAEAADAAATVTDAGPGVYRGEIRVEGWDAPWVLTNAIVVADEATAARRRAATQWPTESAPPEPVEVIDTFDGATGFDLTCDSASPAKSPLLDPAGGTNGSGAALLHFALAPPTPAHPDVFCALVDGRSRNLAGKRGLEFAIRGDGGYRLWVQVRDANPASADEGTEWWFASVKTTDAWRRVAVPFASLRSINPKTDGRLDLDQVRALVFVLDKGSVKTGVEGRIWIDDVGIY